MTSDRTYGVCAFDDFWLCVHPHMTISASGGITGTEDAPNMREITISISGTCRIYLRPDGTYSLDVCNRPLWEK